MKLWIHVDASLFPAAALLAGMCDLFSLERQAGRVGFHEFDHDFTVTAILSQG